MEWVNAYLNADVEAEQYARSKQEKAEITVRYYPECNGTIRKVIEVNFKKSNQFYCEGIKDD